ncbi:uncharacterized protein At4g33100 [Nymphaea colorata]|uniref:uncharacterized protein At4g33100 n=1 Tax=Nymphaea colorata TaxID=210225 RepID=UPI00129D3EC7|nr:uncharacterized protein At4g33100 [Nymphaea colorata]XP_031480750.1 uncharacterized protein At4g33100 [Nymphaea colorata]XP_031480758.1 uncharacterized protein At4g33100 [Nymphaea colorata]XP_031480766.1 uncharacterized protein At4g33100 [Nymphaea colorata]
MGLFRSRKGSGGAATSSCSELRNAYNDCFNKWYAEKYMKGQRDKHDCVAEWEKYRACLMQFLEDKHLSRLLEAEAVAHSTREYTNQSATSDRT